MTAADRLLLLGCSKAKCDNPEPLPALERYDGPPFRVLRKYLRQHPDPTLRVYILSAEFGLIPADQAIPPYDRQMTPTRARELRPSVRTTLDQIVPPDARSGIDATSFLVVLGKRYLPALIDPADERAGRLQSRVAGGGQGRKLTVLRDWLIGLESVR